MNQPTKEAIRTFIDELSGFATIAENTLETIDKNPEVNQRLFEEFSERMLAIRGTAQQLSFPHIAHIAEFGEELAVKGAQCQTRNQMRKCISCLWDAITTVRFMLQNPNQETSEEQKILINRLERTLKSLGGARPKMSVDEIDAMLKNRPEN